MIKSEEKEPVFSVIIPAYNSGEFIANALESVLLQGFQDFEIIVVDDGSTDITKQVIEQFRKKDERIRYYYQENQGVSVARNAGIAKAVGEYIAFLDSDDTLEPVFLETMYSYIRTSPGDLYYSGCYCRREGKIVRKIPEDFEVGDPLLHVLRGGNLANVGCWCIRRTFLSEINLRFPVDCYCGEDIEFFHKLLYRVEPGRKIAIRKYLTNYNLRSNSLTQRQCLWYSLKMPLGVINAMKGVYDYIADAEDIHSSIYIPVIAKRMQETYLYYLWGTLLLGSKQEFKVLLDNYNTDKMSYLINIPLKGMKNKVWEFCITTKMGQWVGRFIFRPYKYLQRSYQQKRWLMSA